MTLSDAFQEIIDTAKGVTDTQKQEIRDRYAAERERVLATTQWGDTAYEQASTYASIQSQLEALRSKMAAELSNVQEGGVLESNIMPIFSSLGAGKANPASLEIENVAPTADQIGAMQGWLDDLFALLKISDNTALKDQVVEYLASLPEHIRNNPTDQVLLDIADIVGINPYELHQGGLAEDLRNYLSTMPQTVIDLLTVVATLPLHSVVSVSDVDGILREQTAFALYMQLQAARENVESFTDETIGMNSIWDLDDIDQEFETDATNTTKDSLRLATDEIIASFYRVMDSHDLFGVEDVNNYFRGVAIHEIDKSLRDAVAFVTHTRMTSPFHLDIGNMISISTGGLASRIQSAIDNAVSSAISHYQSQTIHQQLEREYSAPRSLNPEPQYNVYS